MATNTTSRKPEAGAVAAYRKQQVSGARPEQLMLELYDYGVAGCLKEDSRLVSAVLVELIAALNFDHEEIATGFFRLYDYCLRQVKRGQFEMPLKILRELRETWAVALSQSQALAVNM